MFLFSVPLVDKLLIKTPNDNPRRGKTTGAKFTVTAITRAAREKNLSIYRRPSARPQSNLHAPRNTRALERKTEEKKASRSGGWRIIDVNQTFLFREAARQPRAAK
jgi:hypothetical protein